MSKNRVLGHLRIFQSVQADLNMANRWDKQSYEYEGIDPFNLEDDAFPITVGLIEGYAINKQIETVDQLLTILTRPDTQKVLKELRETLTKELIK